MAATFGNVRLKKRLRAPSTDRNGSQQPLRKMRATEDKMAARLRNFHLSPPNQRDSDWFFVRKPAETLADIEDRLSTSSHDSDHNIDGDRTVNEVNQLPRLKVASDEVKKMLAESKLRTFEVARAVNPCTEVILWQPRDEIIKSWDSDSSLQESANTDTDQMAVSASGLSAEPDVRNVPVSRSSSSTSAFTECSISSNDSMSTPVISMPDSPPDLLKDIGQPHESSLNNFRDYCSARTDGPVRIYNINGLMIEELSGEHMANSVNEMGHTDESFAGHVTLARDSQSSESEVAEIVTMDVDM